jgi:hypothetical protein
MPGEPYLTTNSTNLKWLGATGGITIMGSMKSESDSLSTFQITDFPAFIKIGGSFSEAGDISIFIVSSAVLGWPNQMTINALNSGGTWNANSYVRAVTQTLTPLYNTLPGEFADGAVGEVPFTVHDEASDFYNLESDNVTPAPTWSEFNNDSDCDQDVIVEFYGPVRVTDDPAYTGGPVLSVVFNDPLPQGGIDTELSHLMRFTIVGTTPTGKRQVRIDALPGNHLPWGTYTVRNWRDGRVKPLVCDDLLTAAEVAVRDFECSFVLANDCADANGDFDCVLDADCGIVFPYTLCDSIDFNNDGLFPDTTDVSDFIQVFGGGACSTNVCNDIDFNNDGLFPDTMDIQAFLSVFSGGGCVI